MKKAFVFATAIALVCGLSLNAQTPKTSKTQKKEVKMEVKKVEPKQEMAKNNVMPKAKVKTKKTITKKQEVKK